MSAGLLRAPIFSHELIYNNLRFSIVTCIASLALYNLSDVQAVPVRGCRLIGFPRPGPKVRIADRRHLYIVRPAYIVRSAHGSQRSLECAQKPFVKTD
jgi:hypothetical protein